MDRQKLAERLEGMIVDLIENGEMEELKLKFMKYKEVI